MKPRHSNLTLPASALAALTALALGGTSYAATLYGLAQPGWENDPDPGPPIYNEPIADGNSIYLDAFGTGWRDGNHHQGDLSNYPIGIVVGDGGLSSGSQLIVQSSGSGISSSLVTSDPAGAAAWLSSLPNDAHRQIASISLGATITDPATLDAALRLAMERWLALSTSEDTERIEFLDGNRGRGRGDESFEREILLSWLNSDPSLAADPAFGSGSLASVVPEPSVSLLGALGALGLLRRRRVRA